MLDFLDNDTSLNAYEPSSKNCTQKERCCVLDMCAKLTISVKEYQRKRKKKSCGFLRNSRNQVIFLAQKYKIIDYN